MTLEPEATERERAGRPRMAWPRNPALAAGALVLLTVGYFQNTRPGWNVNSQLALTAAIAERGTLSIDAYHEQGELATGDKALFEGRFYTDKSPVTSFLGVPAFVLYRAGVRIAGAEFSYSAARYWTTWLTIGLASGLLAMFLSFALERRGVPEGHAAAAAALWVIATPLLGYSILFFNYVPACAMALGGFLLVESRLEPGPRPANGARDSWRLFAGGALLGLAAWTLPTFALAALLMTAFIAWRLVTGARKPSQGGAKLAALAPLLPWMAGGALGVVGYAVYSIALFGEVTSPYRYEFDQNFRAQMERGLMGAGLPDWRVLVLITLHPFRGLFVLFPATLLALAGLAVQLRRRQTASALALAFLAGLLVYNSGYFMWWGGWAYAPRHLIPALPLMGLGLAPWLRARGPWLLATFWTVLLVGSALNVAAVSLDPQPPPGLAEIELYDPAGVARWPNPFFDLIGHVLRGQTDSNWGTRMGLRGVWSLWPLACLWLLGLWWMLVGAAGSGGSRIPRRSRAPT